MATDFRIGLPIIVPMLAAVVEYANTCKVGLFTDTVIPTDWRDLGEYSQPVNSGYLLVTPTFIMPEDPAPPVLHALSSPIEWEADPAGVDDLVRGWFLFDEELEEVVLALLYGAPEPFIRDGPFWITADLTAFATVFE